MHKGGVRYANWGFIPSSSCCEGCPQSLTHMEMCFSCCPAESDGLQASWGQDPCGQRATASSPRLDGMDVETWSGLASCGPGVGGIKKWGAIEDPPTVSFHSFFHSFHSSSNLHVLHCSAPDIPSIRPQHLPYDIANRSEHPFHSPTLPTNIFQSAY